MRKILLGLLIGLGMTAGIAYAATSIFSSQQIGHSVGAGYVLQTDGANPGVSTWVATSTLGITGGGTPGSPIGGLQYNNSGSFGGVATGTPGYVLAASSTSASGYAWVVNTAALGATTTITTNVLTNGPNFTFSSGTPDTNIGLVMTGSGATITLQPTFSGTLAAGRLNSNVVQILATGTSGSIFNGSISGQTLTLNLPFASASNTGQLQAADWTTFNSKVGGSGTTNNIPIFSGSGTLTNSSLSQSAGTTLINGATPIIDGGGDWLNNIIQTSGANIILQTPTSTAVLGNFIFGGGVSQFSTSTNITGLQFICGLGLYYLNSTSTLTTNLTFPTLSQMATGASTGCGGGAETIWSSQSGLTIQYNASTSSPVSLTPSGTGETILYAPGTGPISQPGQSVFAVGGFVASSTISGATTTGMSFNFQLAGYQPRATNPTMQGQFLMASSTATGGNPEWTIGNIIAGSNITVTTTTPGQITIASSGGAGTTSPFTAGYIPEATGTNVTLSNSNIFQTTAGNIGIGTSTPQQKLVVIASTSGASGLTVASTGGTFYVPSGTNRHDVLIGINAGPTVDYNPTSSAYISTFPDTSIGYLAGNAQVASTTGSCGAGGCTGINYGNTAVGAIALNTCTTCQENTAIGMQALVNLVTGFGNTAIGLDAGELLNGVNYNTVLGNDAFVSNTSGTSNTVAGHFAVFNNQSSNYLTISGDSAAYHLVSGDQNTILGHNAYYTALTGQQNVIIGESANKNATSSYNTVIGVLAGANQSNLTGATNQLNSILGYSSGANLTSGSENLLFGYEAGYSLQTGNNNIVIGDNIDLPATTTSNTLDVANLIYATGLSNYSGGGSSASISSGNVGIGTSTPGNALTVIGSISSSALTSGNCVQAGAGGLLTTIGSACGSGGGSGNSAWTIGNGLIYNATSTDLIGVGTITPTTTLFVQGKGGKNPFAVASSSGSTMFAINQLGQLIPTTISNTNPEYSFAGDTGTGIHDAGSQLNFQIGGATNLEVASTFIYTPIQFESGINSITAPAYSEFGDSGTGLWLNGTKSTGLTTNGVERLRFDPSGFGGINTTTPNATLEIVGYSGSTTPTFVVASSTGVSQFQVKANGDVLDAELTSGNCVQAGAGGLLTTTGSACGSGGSSGGLGTTSPFSAGYIPEATGTNITLSNSNIFQTTAGNIGIGTSSPQGSFHIQNSSYPVIIQGNTGASSGSKNWFSVPYKNGLLSGFYNDAFTATTTVIKLSNSTGNRDTIMGINAGPLADYETSNGSVFGYAFPETAIGYNALNSFVASTTNTTAGNFAYGDAAVGSYTLSSCVTCAESSAFGSYALNNATGFGNTGLGMDAGRGITTGSSNTAVGNDSLISGNIGASITGSNNTTLGWEAAAGITNGSSYNTIVGAQTAFVNSVINHNVLIGDATDYNLASGANNVLIGDNAYNNVSTSTNNTIIGKDAGVGTNGSSSNSNNVMLGFLSGNKVTTGSGNIFLGTDSGYNETTGGNELFVNNIQQASLANDKIYSLLYGNFSGSAGSLTGQQLTVNAATTTLNSAVIIPSLTGTQCIHEISGVLSGTGSDCGSGGSGNSAWTIGNGLIYNATSTDLVGIGSTTPSATLTIQGKSGTNLLTIASSSTAASLLTMYPTGGILYGIPPATSPGDPGAGNLYMINNSDPLSNIDTPLNYSLFLNNENSVNSSSTGIGFAVTGNNAPHNIVGAAIIFKRTGGSSQGELQFYTQNNTGGGVAPLQAMVINNSQLIGIGSSTPTALLTLQGYSGATTDLFNIATNTGVSLFKVLSNGNIGIGSSTPIANLVVQGVGGQTQPLLQVSSSSGTSIFKIFADGGMAYATSTPDATTTVAFAGQYYSAEFDNGTSTATTTIDWGKANTQRIGLASSSAIGLVFANYKPGGRYLLLINEATTTAQTVNWPAAVHWSGGTAPTLTSGTYNQVDIVTFVCGFTSCYGGSNLNFSP